MSNSIRSQIKDEMTANSIVKHLVEHLKNKSTFSIKTLKKGNHRVNLVGVQHLGFPEYYQKVLSHLNPSATATLMEGLTDHNKLSTAPKIDYKQLTVNTSLKQQKDYINDSSVSNPINADIDFSSLNILEKKLIENFSLNLNIILDTLTGKTPFKTSSLIIKGFSLIVHFKILLHHVILHRRNKQVVTKILDVISSNQTSDIDVIWGAAHSPGITKLLINHGFEVE